jgi:hypothetical protein
MSTTTTLKQLQRALQIAEQIAQLENELKAVLAGNEPEEAPAAAPQAPATRTRGKAKAKAKGRAPRGQRTVSPEARARMAAAQKNRRNREKTGK